MADKVEAVVVGAGPAGCAAAYALASQGVQTLLIERAEEAGQKNLSGGKLWAAALYQLIPDFAEEAPLERPITHHQLGLLTRESAFTTDFTTTRLGKAPYNGFTVLRAPFDRWFARRAEEAGALLLQGHHIDSLIKDEQGAVIGVRQDQEELYAGVTVLAEGGNALLAQQAGLLRETPHQQNVERLKGLHRYKVAEHHLALGIKEVWGLPAETIEERFRLEPDQGFVAEHVCGFYENGVRAGGFLYTNRETLSVGTIVQLASVPDHSQVTTHDTLEDYRLHPAIAPYLKGAQLLEYGAHIVPEGGYKMLPKLYGEGVVVVGDAAGFLLANGLTIDGMNLGIESGRLAAQAIVEGRERAAGGYPAAALKRYADLVRSSFVMRDLRTFRKASRITENPRLYWDYPRLIEHLMSSIFEVDGEPRAHTFKNFRAARKEAGVGWLSLSRDALGGLLSA